MHQKLHTKTTQVRNPLALRDAEQRAALRGKAAPKPRWSACGDGGTPRRRMMTPVHFDVDDEEEEGEPL